MKKRSYLYRLVAIIILSLFIPIVFFFNYFWKKSFEEMKQSNEIYYENLVGTFMNSFHEKTEDFRKHVHSIVAKSKDTKNVLYNGGELLQKEYWRHYAINNLQYDFFDFSSTRCGIYYYDLDLLLFRGSIMNSNQYINTILNIGEDNYNIKDCFELENYVADKIVFAPISEASNGEGKLLVGYCTSLGKNYDKVMIFYLLSGSSYWQEGNLLYGNEDTALYILDKMSDQVLLRIGESTNVEINWKDVEKKTKGFQSVYRIDDAVYPLSFALSILENSLQSNILNFYHDMRIIIVVVALVLLIICSLSIYIVYRPIYQLTNELDWDGIGEIESIRNALDNRRAKILEQEMLILDLLLGHLIYGVPLSLEKIVHLGISKEMKHYCVILAEGCVLLNSEMQQLTDDLEKSFPVRVFMKEWQEENRSIMVFFMKSSSAYDLETYISEWLENHSTETAQLFTGNVVERLDDIRSSFLSCFKKKEEVKADVKINVKNEVKKLREQNEQQKRLKDEVLAYIELHYREEDLSQTKVADYFQISNYTLSRMFKSQVGVGFAEYVNSKRLELAKELLLTTSYSVREISLMVGYSSDNYFYRLFKSTMGISTSEFREKR